MKNMMRGHVLRLSFLSALILGGCAQKQDDVAKLEKELQGKMDSADTSDVLGLDTLQNELSDSEYVHQALKDLAHADDTVVLPPEIDTTSTEQARVQVDSQVPQSIVDSHPLSTNQESAVKEEAKEAVNEVVKEAPMPPRPTGPWFTVQIASTPSKKYAEQVVDSFKVLGYEPYISQTERDGRTYYRIRVGQFESSTEATIIKSELQSKYGVNGWVDRES